MKKTLCYLKVFGKVLGGSLLVLSGIILILLGYMQLCIAISTVIAHKLNVAEFHVEPFVVLPPILLFVAIGITFAIIADSDCCDDNNKPKKKAKKKAIKKVIKKLPPKIGNQWTNPLRPSHLLGEIVGHEPKPRHEVVKRLWGHMKKHGLQDKKNRRMLNVADNPLTKNLFHPKKVVSMFEMTKLISKHLHEVK